MSITSQNGCSGSGATAAYALEERAGRPGAEHHREVRRCVRGVEPRRPGRGLHPVDDAADRAVRPQQVAVAEVAVQERRLVRRLRPGQHLEGAAPRVGVPRPGRHHPLRLPRPGLEGRGTARPGRSRWICASRSAIASERVVGRPRPERAPGQPGHEVARRRRRRCRPRRARGSSVPGRRCRPGTAGPRARGRSARHRGCATARWSSAGAPTPRRRRRAARASSTSSRRRALGRHHGELPRAEPAQASASSYTRVRLAPCAGQSEW